MVNGGGFGPVAPDLRPRTSMGSGGDMRKAFLAAAIVALGLSGAQAQPYPSRPVTIVVPFAAGGPTDAIARAISERMRVSLGQTVIVENVTGAGGSTGVGRAVRAAPDGYTLSLGHTGTHVVNGAIYPLLYDLLNEFEPISLIASNPMMLVTKNAVPAKSLRELIDWLKTNSDKVATGTAGVGSASHFSGVYFQNLIKVPLNFVPYRGTGPALQDLVAGQIDMIVDQASNALTQVQAGTIRAYAITDAKRLAVAPDIPTAEDAGLPGFQISLWNALWAPKGTPKETVAKLNAAVMDALADPAVRPRPPHVRLENSPPQAHTPHGHGAHP